jgi:hypothetical protein
MPESPQKQYLRKAYEPHIKVPRSLDLLTSPQAIAEGPSESSPGIIGVPPGKEAQKGRIHSHTERSQTHVLQTCLWEIRPVTILLIFFV